LTEKATAAQLKATGFPVAEHDLRVLGESADLVTDTLTQSEERFNLRNLNKYDIFSFFVVYLDAFVQLHRLLCNCTAFCAMCAK
jgi:hypothetical protein